MSPYLNSHVRHFFILLFSQIKSARKTGGDVKEKRKSEDVRKSETLQEEEELKLELIDFQ